MKIIDGDF